MDRKQVKSYFSKKESFPYISDSEWRAIEVEVVNFKDDFLKAYYEDIEDLETLTDFFHPTNDTNFIIDMIPLANKPKKGPIKSSFFAFKKEVNSNLKTIEENPFSYFVFGALYIEQMEVTELISFIKNSHLKLKNFDQEQHFKSLLAIFDHLPESRLIEIKNYIY